MAKKHPNKNLPFFAYGIFKPGQIAFSKIENCVDEIIYSKINYEMLIRDGVPIIGDEESNNLKTYGYLIYFKDESINNAYDIINQTEPNDLYFWDVIATVEGTECNVLKGVEPKKGSNEIESGNIQEFHGQNDPIFREALQLVDDSLKIKLQSLKPSDDFKTNIKEFFILQMHYMLLWTAIDRFESLRYNNQDKTDGKDKIHISQEECFEDIFEKHYAKSKGCSKNREIYNSKHLAPREINSDVTSDWAMNYYYTVRCNVVHRGKTIHDDQDHLKCSLIELSKIFKDILKYTFNIVTINGIDFCIPYGLKEVTDENDSTRVFKKDETNQIKGIPNYTIGISSDINDFGDCYSIGENYFNIKIIDVDNDKKRNIIRHLNDKLNKV